MFITSLYAALCALLVIVLAFRVSQMRRARGIGVGDGGDPELMKRIRVHANAVEYIPLSLLLLLILELNRTDYRYLHAFGITLLVARIAHAAGLSQTTGSSAGRMIGMVLNLLLLLVMALMLIWEYLPR